MSEEDGEAEVDGVELERIEGACHLASRSVAERWARLLVTAEESIVREGGWPVERWKSSLGEEELRWKSVARDGEKGVLPRRP